MNQAAPSFERCTRKLYYEEPCWASASAAIVKIGADYLELDATVAYPEGGGQPADRGTIRIGHRQLRFTDARKIHGHPVVLDDYPDVLVEGVIWHRVHREDRPVLEELAPGMPVRIEIDVRRRALFTLAHTASHLLFLGVALNRPDAALIAGEVCEDMASLDFNVELPFCTADLARIERSANEFVLRNASMHMSSHPAVPDARTWHCESHSLPCCGMHLRSAGPVGAIRVTRQALGRTRERLKCQFPSASIDTTSYRGVTAAPAGRYQPTSIWGVQDFV